MALTTITNAMVSVNAIQGTLIADNAITAVHIATNAVSGTLIADNAITAVHIAQNVVTVTQLADDAVEADKIADGVITTNHLNKAMISSQTEVTAVAGDFVLLGDTSDSNNLKKALVSSLAPNAVPLAGGTMTGNLVVNAIVDADNFKINGGQGSDGQVLTSTGSGVAWEDAAGGVAGISSSADATAITITSGEEVGIGTTDPASYDNNAAGISSNLVVADSGHSGIIVIAGTSSDAAISFGDGTGAAAYRGAIAYVNSQDKLYFKSGGSNRMIIDSSGNVGINETSPDFSGFGSNGGGLELDDVGANFTAVKVSQGSTGNLYLAASTGAGYLWQYSNSPLIIGTNNAERIRIQDGTGRVGINATGIAYSSSEKLSLYNDNFGFGIKASYYAMGCWVVESSGTYISFAYGSGGAGGGGITFSGASTSYTSASDYRLKENVDYTWDATTRLKQLKPCRFNWISDNSNTLQDGFLAHEVSTIVPEAVSGEKDAVYTAEEAQEAPNTAEGDAKIQALDNAKLVPLLVKTIQELEARITTLEG